MKAIMIAAVASINVNSGIICVFTGVVYGLDNRELAKVTDLRFLLHSDSEKWSVIYPTGADGLHLSVHRVGCGFCKTCNISLAIFNVLKTR